MQRYQVIQGNSLNELIGSVNLAFYNAWKTAGGVMRERDGTWLQAIVKDVATPLESELHLGEVYTPFAQDAGELR